MGRFWNSNNHSGKFGFAVQPSDDPLIFGMEEQEPTEINYYLDNSEESIEQIKKVLNQQYDILGIKEEDRIYHIENEDDVWKLLDKYHDQNYRPADDEDRANRAMLYHDEKVKGGVVPIKDGITLAECRLNLGLNILDDLERDGYCELYAEC